MSFLRTVISKSRHVLVITSSILLALLLLSIIVLSQYFGASKHSIFLVNEAENYQILEYIPQAKEFRNGAIDDILNIPSGDYTSYLNSDGNVILVSKLDLSRFMCSGICFCEERTEMNRRSSIPLKRPFVYFVAALSSILAFQISKNELDEICINELGEYCLESSINSEISECSDISDKIESETRSTEGGNDDDDEYKYKCEGYCSERGNRHYFISKWEHYLNTNHARTEYVIRFNMKYMRFCEQYRYSSVIRLELGKDVTDPSFIDDIFALEHIAKEKFENEILAPFCYEQSTYSLEEMEKEWKSELGREHIHFFEDNKVLFDFMSHPDLDSEAWCTAKDKNPDYYVNRNIRCSEISQ